tara:strand:- start:524 stop:1468 length:945 start_codon:yes stop_codon:yes gene_type:complete
MAQPTNTFDTYDSVGIREDLSNVIYNVSPEETPLLSSIAKVKASSTLHEWLTDTLRDSAVNAHIEGDDTAAEARTAATRLQNSTQIFKNAVVTSGTDDVVDNAGRGKEMSYQIVKVGQEQKLDQEKAIMANQARVGGNSTTARKMAGLGAFVTTNVTNVGTNGANPTGDGSNARTDGTQTVFTQADFDSAMQGIWAEGGKPDCVILSAFQMDKALGFVGNNNQRSTGASGKVENLLNVYVTPWGSVEFIPARENRPRDVWIVEKDKLALASLRPMKSQALAKTGDNEKRQVVSECTLVVRNEKALGLVADCTTS